MHKGLLIWNIALTLLLAVVFLGGCTLFGGTDLTKEINANRDEIRANRELIVQNSVAIEELRNWSKEVTKSTEQYVKEYVEWYVSQKS